MQKPESDHKFSTAWKSSTQPRKQRKYRYNAPLHLKQKSLRVHLSPELRKKYGFRNVLVHKGDKVKVMSGQFAKREGKVNRVWLKRERVYVDGVELIKKEGSKVPLALAPAKLMILELELGDKIRREKLERKIKGNKTHQGERK